MGRKKPSADEPWHTLPLDATILRLVFFAAYGIGRRVDTPLVCPEKVIIRRSRKFTKGRCIQRETIDPPGQRSEAP